ncbi:MAG: marine proteobacterial sortase target protein [bacterium]|nr:marine proteobacterial sortase target protein [bacterium]
MKRKKMFILTLWTVLFAWGLLTISPSEALAQKEESQNKEIAGILYANAQNSKEKVFLPLKQTDVKLNVIAGIVKTNVTQVFSNEADTALEAVYIFPLPSRAAVTGMELKIGGRTIKSVIKEREAAKKVFKAAKAAGKKTALIEQERPNIFTTSVANILPGETVEVSFSYLETVDFQKGTYTVNFPMVVGQRYIPYNTSLSNYSGSGADSREGEQAKEPALSSGTPDAARLNPPVLHPNIDNQHKLTITADITGIPVSTVTSATHDILVDGVAGEESLCRVTLAEENTIPDCDFNMKIQLREEDAPQVSFIKSVKEEASYAMLTVFPPLGEGLSSFAIPRDVTFLIDTSGSMSGQSIRQAQDGLKLCMQMLRTGDRFNIVRFSSDYSSFRTEMQPVDGGTIGEALVYIEELRADGGTEMQQALTHVLDIPGREGSMKMVVFLTDGAVGNENSLLRLLEDRLGRSRLFTFGIGSAPNEFLMRKMAERGRGQARFIHTNEDIGDVMSNFFKTLESPVMTDISISWQDGGGSSENGLEFYPALCPDVYYQRPLQVFLKYPGQVGGQIFISGKLGDKPVKYQFSVDDGSGIRFDAVDRMFGKWKIDDLMYRLNRAGSQKERDRLKQMVITESLGFQILSKYTARVAVEEIVSRDPAGQLKTVKVPVPLPRGWQPPKLNPTATNELVLFLIGLALLLLALITYLIGEISGLDKEC